MAKKKKKKFIALATTSAIVASALAPVAALADEGTETQPFTSLGFEGTKKITEVPKNPVEGVDYFTLSNGAKISTVGTFYNTDMLGKLQMADGTEYRFLPNGAFLDYVKPEHYASIKGQTLGVNHQGSTIKAATNFNMDAKSAVMYGYKLLTDETKTKKEQLHSFMEFQLDINKMYDTGNNSDYNFIKYMYNNMTDEDYATFRDSVFASLELSIYSALTENQITMDNGYSPLINGLSFGLSEMLIGINHYDKKT